MPFFKPSSLLACSFLTLLVVTGCAKERSSHTEVNYGWTSPYPVDEPQSDVVRTLERAPLTCSGGCPAETLQLGLIGLATETKDWSGKYPMGQCTGFMIAPNIVATNAHCLPPVVMEARDCGEVLGIKFLRPDSQARTTYACKKVLKRASLETDPLDGPDYGFFQIDAPERTPVRIARSGIADFASVHSVRVDPLGNGVLGGSISEAYCNTTQRSLLNTRYTSEFSPTALAIGCSAEHGNSGSPVFNQLGEVIGILQAKKKPEFLALLRDPMRQLGAEVPGVAPNHFVFTNLSCVEDPETGRLANEAACSAAHKGDFLATIGTADFAKDADVKASAAIQAWRQRLPSIAYWKFSFDKKVSMVSAFPRCLRPLADWPEEIRETQDRQGLFWRKKTFRFSYETGMRVSPKLELDAQMRFRPQAQIQTQVTSWNVELTTAGEGSEVETMAESTDPQFKLRMPLSGSRWCSAEELAQGDDDSELSQAAAAN